MASSDPPANRPTLLVAVLAWSILTENSWNRTPVPTGLNSERIKRFAFGGFLGSMLATKID